MNLTDHFLTLNPDIAVITSVSPDHLDIYKNKENLENLLTDFTNKIKTGGTLFLEDKALILQLLIEMIFLL